MSLLSLTVFIILILISTAKTNNLKETSTTRLTPGIQNFKEFVTNMIEDQSSKIQTLLKKIQTNAQFVLMKIENIKQEAKFKQSSKYLDVAAAADSARTIQLDEHQLETPMLKKSLEGADTEIAESRNFNNYHGSTSYGVSGNANYGGHLPTYHHHSIGFDPINIVVSVSLLSFLLQALQGLLSRTRFPTQVVEGRYLNPVQEWLKKLEGKHFVSAKKEYRKHKYAKKYYA